MKQSHLITPRTLDTCEFRADADPIDRPMDREDRIVVGGCIIAVVFLIGLFAGGAL